MPLSAKIVSCPSPMEKILQENFIDCAKYGLIKTVQFFCGPLRKANNLHT